MAKVKLEDLKYVGTPNTVESEPAVEEVEEVVVPEVVESESEVDTSNEVVEVEEEPELAPTVSASNVTLNVRKLRIYSIPSTKVPARSFTGNVVVIGKVDKFAIVEYVRSGFGKVKGYAIDSELPRA